ncbi:MAG: hypothetical protein ACRENC_18005, partial [Gemmatimonadaceae bacterium]
MAAAVSMLVVPAGLLARQAQGQRGGAQQGQQQGGQQGQRGGRAAGQGRANGPARDNPQQVTQGTGAIAGTISIEGSGTAARRARMSINGPELRPARSAIT